MRLKNRIAVVTGAATGLGKAAALRLASEGAVIEILDLKDASEAVSEIEALGGKAYSTICDCADEDQIAAAVKAIEARHGYTDILVNNAGILTGRKPWYTLSREEVNRYVQVNYIGYFLVTKAFYPLIKLSKTPRVIMVASRTYFLANPGQMSYVASKGAVMGMTRVLAKEMGEEGIPVNAFNRVMGNQAIKKRVTPEHLAGLIAFLASDDGELITGQMILCDGGGYLH
jgi:3-oxoacyl-[acyl-carrier protein] reductase